MPQLMRSTVLATIQSVRFSSAFLRIEGTSIPSSVFGGVFPEGIGNVNCQFYSSPQDIIPTIGIYEVFELIPIPQVPNHGWAIRSWNFPNLFLRIDGSNVTQFQQTGSGKVNCQYYASGTYPIRERDYERLLISSPTSQLQVENIYTIQGNFPGVYLRMDGNGVDGFNGNGSGIVNCQYYPDAAPQNLTDYELFYINILPPFKGPF